MSVNGINGVNSNAYEAYPVTQQEQQANKTAEENSSVSEKKESGVVYEPTAIEAPAKTYKQNTELINKMKADAEAHTKQLQNIVQQLMSKQTETFGIANDMWKFLASGKFEVDAATKAQAQEDISEDGYWGVKQTSNRILDFATALTGGDPSKIEDMRKAFEKGYKQAEDTWGGELPEISKQTYDAVMAGFDKMAEEAEQAAQTNSQILAQAGAQAITGN